MKSRILILLSALALMVLVAMQFMFVTDTYVTKQKQFDSRHGNLVKKGMSFFTSEDYNFAFDSVMYVLDNLALEYIYGAQDSLPGSPGVVFQKAMADYHQPEIFLRDFIRKVGEKPDFTYHVLLNELSLIDMGYEKQVYPDSLILSTIPQDALLAGSYTYERNFFRISYDIYIDFQNRNKMIWNEMWLILSLSVFTLLLVFTVFYITLRNMLLQKRLSEMKTDFINNMTHELKTPLSTISVASSSLGKRSVIQQEKMVEELSHIIKKQNRHLSELIDRILDINIWERDQVRLKRQEVKVSTWIRDLTQAFLLKQEGSGLEIDLEVHDTPELIWMDEVHMSTAINNILSNAVKYGSHPCKIKLVLSRNKGFMDMAISDNGPGIRREELKHIFEKFYRGKESKERVIKGLGLGLYYVKQITEAHGGSLTAKSTPGKGAEFIIQIPIQNGNTSG
ncbi:MAG: HAMP domain-containing sensor histidine kinase [Bacteroides sp.]|nr:HAMP domain-containing sensor histidine kinase [Bacteroides sp.]